MREGHLERVRVTQRDHPLKKIDGCVDILGIGQGQRLDFQILRAVIGAGSLEPPLELDPIIWCPRRRPKPLICHTRIMPVERRSNTTPKRSLMTSEERTPRPKGALS